MEIRVWRLSENCKRDAPQMAVSFVTKMKSSHKAGHDIIKTKPGNEDCFLFCFLA